MAKNKAEHKSAIRRIANALDMPNDILFNLPRLMMTGNEEIYIENYRGIICYSETEIKLNTSKMPVKITGDKLSITQIATEEITIAGKIKAIEFCK